MIPMTTKLSAGIIIFATKMPFDLNATLIHEGRRT